MEAKKTSLYDKHVEHGGKIIEFAGWSLPVQYEGLVAEHTAVRTAAGLFDVSHMGEVDVTGEETLEFVNYLVTNDVNRIKDQGVMYTMMCLESGGIVDDLLVYRYNQEHAMLVINASNVEKDFEHMQQVAKNFKVTLHNKSSQIAQIALQGPQAEAILRKLTSFNLSAIEFFTFMDPVDLSGNPFIVSRTGYTGEDGFEIYGKGDDIATLWDILLSQGKEEGLVPVGLGARDTLRFEANLPLYGNELSETITPLEAGLGMFVKLDKADFMGKEALATQKEKGLERKIVGLEIKGKGIIRHGYPIVNGEGEEIGHVTTGYYLPSSDKNIGLGMMDKAYTAMGTQVYIKVRKRLVEAEVRNKRFMDKNYKKK